MGTGLKLGYYFLKNLIFGIKYPFGLSFDVTNKCNLRCKHCYFLEQNHLNELSDEDFIKKVKEIKNRYPTIIFVSWVGGEPLLRKNILNEGMKLFPFNVVVTNGTIELPAWKNCVFNISVDGTEKHYEKIRGRGFYKIVKKHADRNDIKVNIACVLNKNNYECVEDLLDEWKNTKIGGINFDFYTPIKGIKDDLWLDWQLRDKVIDKLVNLKNKYKNFILNSKEVFRMMKSDMAPEITKNCLVPKSVLCLDPLGNKKSPCVIGEKADCLRCGCIASFQAESILKRNKLKSFFITKKLFT